MILAELFSSLSDFADSPWLPLLIFVIAAADSVIPIVPSETLVIVGGVAAGTGDQNIGVVIACGAIGAFLGDNLAYELGKTAEGLLRKTLFRGPKGDHRIEWAKTQLDRRGGLLLITGRFIPGGRTVITVMSGATERPRKWFAFFIAIAATIWASYAGLLGYLGGKTFEDSHTKAFVVAFAAALSVTLVIELVRHLLGKRADRKQTQPA